jgi:hypothetical protein
MEKACCEWKSIVYVRKNELALIDFVGMEINDFRRPQLYEKWLFSNTEW